MPKFDACAFFGGDGAGIFLPSQAGRCLPWGLVTGLMLPGYFLREFEPHAEMGLDLKRFLCFSALVAAGLDPLSS